MSRIPRPSILQLLILTAVLTGCLGKDRWEGYRPLTGSSLWTDSILRAEYLWKEGLPASNDLTSSYFLSPAQFLEKVRNEEDSYSMVDSLHGQGSSSQGLAFAYFRSESDTISAILDMVEQGSVGQAAGLQRGDMVIMQDSSAITARNYKLLEDGKAHRLTVTRESGKAFRDTFRVDLPAASPLRPAHVLSLKRLETASGGIAYINLRQLSLVSLSELREHLEKTDIRGCALAIVDLRYCSDGSLDAVRLMAGMLAPKRVQSGILALCEESGQRHEVTFPPEEEMEGLPMLNLEAVIFITSLETALESEILIHCLRPLMTTALVGESTFGSNLARREHVHTQAGFRLLDVAARVLDSSGKADYVPDGLEPDLEVSPYQDPARILPFGNPDEMLLHAALSILEPEA